MLQQSDLGGKANDQFSNQTRLKLDCKLDLFASTITAHLRTQKLIYLKGTYVKSHRFNNPRWLPAREPGLELVSYKHRTVPA